MRKISISLLLIPILICSVGLQRSDVLSVQSFIASDVNNVLTTATSWSYVKVISDDATNWNNGWSQFPSVAIDVDGNVHVVWHDYTNGTWGTDTEIMYAEHTDAGWSNATVISDDVTGWNNDESLYPKIAIDGYGNIHVVWEDRTNGEWGADTEIMYANHTHAGWSNATVISDLYGWNNDESLNPDIAIDSNGNVHVVWSDITTGEWTGGGSDWEIMYTNYTRAGWSNATVISDDATGWNIGSSYYPSIAIDDGGHVHVVWDDGTDGEWGNDQEIMYVQHTDAGWSNATVISDDATGWNNDTSRYPDIAIDGDGNIYVVWDDDTNGNWGKDTEIFYARHTSAGWSNATTIFDDSVVWNTAGSVRPAIAVDGDGNVHVVWQDDTNGEWGSDWEIMYANYTAAGWSNATVISDDATKWNNGWSQFASIAIDGDGNIYVVWQDQTNGEWGTDDEIMYSTKKAAPASDNAGLVSPVIVALPDSSISLLSPLGLGIIGIAIAIAVIISVTITKKIK